MSPLWQLINGPAEAGQKLTFTLPRRIDLVTMITTDLVKSRSFRSIPRRLAPPYLAPVRVAVLPLHRRRKE